MQTVSFIRNNRQPEQRRVRGVRCERTNCDGCCGIETVILQDRGGPSFTGIILATCNGLDLSASHVIPSGDGIDKILILLAVPTLRHNLRLLMRLHVEIRGQDIGHPNPALVAAIDRGALGLCHASPSDALMFA